MGGVWYLGLSQPATEVYLFDLVYENFRPTLANPQNISQNPGYDNQPAFLDNGLALFYASTRNDQTDILRYDLTTGAKTWLTDTPGSEYSPQMIPGKQAFSAVRLETDGTQLLWQYPMGPGVPEVLVPEVKIGYYAWLNSKKVVAFVLGEPATLQLFRSGKKKGKRLGTHIGRSIHSIPHTRGISFVDENIPNKGIIRAMNPQNGKSSRLIAALEGSQDLAWTPDGTIIMAQGAKLYRWTRGVNTTWEEIVDVSIFGLKEITRLAVSPLGDKVAVVVAENQTLPHEQ